MPDTVEPGRYVCVQTGGFVPWVIRAATRSRVDHTLVVISKGLCVEAEPGGVTVSPLSKYAGAFARANLGEPMTATELAAVTAKARSLTGTGYNFAAVGDDLFQDVLGWHWRWLLHLAAAGHELDCSQLAAVCGEAAGKDWSCGRPSPCAVTPADLDRRPGMVRVRL